MSKHNKVERTPAQKAALRDAYKILSAHFEEVLIVSTTRADHDHEAVATDPDVYWKGSWFVVKSLANLAKRRINYRQRNKAEPS